MQAFGAWLREPEVYANFHKAFNNNDRITLTPWTLESRAFNREVVAYLPVNAPHWFRKAIGTAHAFAPRSSTCACSCTWLGGAPHCLEGLEMHGMAFCFSVQTPHSLLLGLMR